VQEEIGCDYSNFEGTNDVSKVAVTAGTTYYVFPDSFNNTSGLFELTLKLEP
jgi:hypothetical protein